METGNPDPDRGADRTSAGWKFDISLATKSQRHEEMIMSLIKNDI